MRQANRLDGDPIAHRMRDDIDLIGLARQCKSKDVLKAVAA
jgi:hypothetical protein